MSHSDELHKVVDKSQADINATIAAIEVSTIDSSIRKSLVSDVSSL